MISYAEIRGECMKKKIAVCGSGWSNEYLEIAMSGIRKCAEECDADVFFLFNF